MAVAGILLAILLWTVFLYSPLIGGMGLMYVERKRFGLLFWIGVLFLMIFAAEVYFPETRDLLLLKNLF